MMLRNYPLPHIKSQLRTRFLTIRLFVIIWESVSLTILWESVGKVHHQRGFGLDNSTIQKKKYEWKIYKRKYENN
jgi:hypothetical protein